MRAAGLGRAFLALSILSVAARARAEEPKGPWRSPEVLEKRLGEACDAVEKACGAPFEKRPSIRISTAAEIEGLVREELEPLQRAAGREDGLDLAVAVAREALVANYHQAAHAIHVVPDNAIRNAEQAHEPLVATEDGLRAVLAHETAHALDFQRFPLVAARSAATSLDELEAWGAVVEGHAQLVAEQVAEATGIAEAFQAFTRSITAVPDLPDETSRNLARITAARLAFAYVAGLDFMKAVHAAGGREGVEAALREPPKSRREIENPGEWLKPREGKQPPLDVAGALGALGPWFEDPSWGIETDSLLRAVLATQLTALPPERRDALTAGYDSGAVLVAVDASADARVIAATFAFRTPELAADFLAAERTISESRDTMAFGAGLKVRDPKYTDGAGAGGKRKGFVAEKTIEGGDQKISTVSHFTLAGRAVLELVLLGDTKIDRPRQDAGVDAVAAVLEGTAPAPKRLERRQPRRQPEEEPPFPDVLGGRPSLRVRVVGPDGEPVPRARVKIAGDLPDRPNGRQSTTVDAPGGPIVVPRLPGKAAVTVDRPRDAAGAPLDYAPARDVPVPDDAKEMTIRLEPALAIEGTVVDPDGKPVAGVVVEVGGDDVRRHLAIDDEQEDLSLVRSGADGSFRLRGVGPEEVEIVTRAAPGLAPGAPVRAKGGATGVTLPMAAGTEVRLLVVDPDGDPVPKARALVQKVTETRLANGASTSWDSIAEVRTGDDGVAYFPGLPRAERYDLSIHPPSGSDLAWIEKARWTPASATHPLPLGFTVEGEVRGEDGRPVGGASVDVANQQPVATDATGRFRIRGCPRGPVRVLLRSATDLGAIVDEATATPGSPTVVLTMRAATRPPTFVPRDATPRDPPPPPVVLFVEGGAGRSLVLQREGDVGASPTIREIGADGRVEIRGDLLDRDATYVAWVRPDPPGEAGDDTSLLRRGLRFDGEPVRLVLEKGKSIRGRFSTSGAVKNGEVGALSPERLIVPGEILPDGTYEIRGLPPGTRWTVKAKARGESAWLYATAEAEAGAQVDLTLAPK